MGEDGDLAVVCARISRLSPPGAPSNGAVEKTPTKDKGEALA